MSLLSVDDLRALVPSPLTDDQLEILIDRVEAEITDAIGVPQNAGGTAEITRIIEGGDANLFLRRPIASVTTLTEYSGLTDTTGTALTEDEEFYVWHHEGRIQRVGGDLPRAAPSVLSVFHMTEAEFSGTSGAGYWGSHAEVVYRPTDQRDLRRGAIIDLCRIWLSRTALMSESVAGEYSYQAPSNWDAEKRRVMRRLSFVEL